MNPLHLPAIRRSHIGAAILLSLTLGMGSCSSQQFTGTVLGSQLGGLFGSSIGGAVGGWRGHDLGGAIGTMVGGALGAAVTADRSRTNDGGTMSDDHITYSRRREMPAPTASQWASLHVSAIRFSDTNDNRALDAGEHATIVMDIYNRGTATLYGIAPDVKCSDSRIVVSPPAIVSQLGPGEGFRYTVEVIGGRRLRKGHATFTVSFGNGRNRVVARSFVIATTRVATATPN